MFLFRLFRYCVWDGGCDANFIVLWAAHYGLYVSYDIPKCIRFTSGRCRLFRVASDSVGSIVYERICSCLLGFYTFSPSLTSFSSFSVFGCFALFRSHSPASQSLVWWKFVCVCAQIKALPHVVIPLSWSSNKRRAYNWECHCFSARHSVHAH